MKAKIPLGKKAKIEELDELETDHDNSSHQDDETGTDLEDVQEEVETTNSSLTGKLKVKINSSQKNTVNSDENNNDSADAKKQKIRSNIIRGVIVLGLIAFLGEEYIFPPKEPVKEPVAPPTSFKRPNRNRPVPAETVDTAAPVEETPAEGLPTETLPTETSAVEADPFETVTTESSPSAEPLAVETTPESPVDVTSTPTTPTEPVETTPPPETFDSISTAPSEDTIDGETLSTTTDENLTDQILQDLEKQAKSTQVVETKKEYVAPPDYEYKGRGLVYNCTGKHWACVDAPSYKICENNASSTKYLQKTPECHPFNIYETQKGCENVQIRMVSASTKTNFCD